MMRSRRSLAGILLFNAITAFMGGVGLMTNNLVPPSAWLERTPFSSYAAPGFILTVAVGGSSLFAAIAVAKKAPDAEMLAVAAGLIMVGWISGELLLIRQWSWLEVLYLTTGMCTVLLAGRIRTGVKE